MRSGDGGPAPDGGGVANDGTGDLVIQDSFRSQNPSDGFESSGYPGIFWRSTHAPVVTSSTIE